MSSDRLQDVKNNGKSLTVRPKKWLWSLTGGGRLLSFTGGSNCKSDWENSAVLDWWSLMGGGHTLRFDCTLYANCYK